MTLTNDMFAAAAIGAGLALVLFRSMGMLKIPALDGSVKPPPAAAPVVHIIQQGLEQPANTPSYEATINVPHKITVTPQVNK